jgi:hypothetical protein
MLRLSQKRRSLLAEALVDAANVAAGALLFGQFLSNQPLSAVRMVVGLAVWIILVGLAIAFAEEEP